MRKLEAAIEVAAEYAYHLYKEDHVPKDKAIAAGVSAVLWAAKQTAAHPEIPHRQRHIKTPGMGFSGEALMGAGSLLSAAGFIRKLLVGA